MLSNMPTQSWIPDVSFSLLFYSTISLCEELSSTNPTKQGLEYTKSPKTLSQTLLIKRETFSASVPICGIQANRQLNAIVQPVLSLAVLELTVLRVLYVEGSH